MGAKCCKGSRSGAKEDFDDVVVNPGNKNKNKKAVAVPAIVTADDAGGNTSASNSNGDAGGNNSANDSNGENVGYRNRLDRQPSMNRRDGTMKGWYVVPLTRSRLNSLMMTARAYPDPDAPSKEVEADPTPLVLPINATSASTNEADARLVLPCT